MRLLILTHHYAPDTSPRAFRWTALAEHFAAQGHEVVVVGAWKPGQARAETRRGVVIWRVGGSMSERLRRRFGGGPTNAPPSSAAGINTRLRNLARRLYAATWQNLYWPDYAALWVAPARRKARQLARESKFDAMFTVSHPFSSHWAGLGVKREAPDLRWICDIGDPYAFLTDIPINNHRLYERRNFAAEAKILAAADAATVTVKTCRDEYSCHFPTVPNMFTVIPPLLSADITLTSTEVPSPSLPKRLIYSGTLYPGLRDPAFLFRLVAALSERDIDIELHIFGQSNGCETMLVDVPEAHRRRVVFRGVVSRPQLIGEMLKAHAMVNIGNRTRHQLPSKIPEYIAVGRPILNLVTGSDDSSLPVLADYPGVLSVPITADPPEPATVARVLEFLKNPPEVDPVLAGALAAPYRIEAVGRAYLSLAKASGRQ